MNWGALMLKNPDPVEAPSGLLERTLGVLELLAANAYGLPLFEIADCLHIPRSATHRVLTSLIEQGYVKQEREQGAYQLTAKVASLAFTFLAGSGITDFAQPLIDRLARESGELVRLAMIDGRELVWVAKAQGSPAGLRYDPDMGQVGRLSCSASGHAWLSCLPDDDARALVEKQGYGMRRDYGPRAPESWPALLKYLRQTRKLRIQHLHADLHSLDERNRGADPPSQDQRGDRRRCDRWSSHPINRGANAGTGAGAARDRARTFHARHSPLPAFRAGGHAAASLKQMHPERHIV